MECQTSDIGKSTLIHAEQIYFRKHSLHLLSFLRTERCTGSWRTGLFGIINIMDADDVATAGARASIIPKYSGFSTSRPRQDGRHFPDDIFKRIFLNENILILTKISLKFVPRGPIYNIPALVLIMVWRRPGDKPLSEPMMVLSTDAYMRHSASMS